MAKKSTGRSSTRRTPSVPATMKAAAIDRFGPPSALTVHRLPVPKPKDDEVLIELHSAGVGSWDASIRDGSWRPGGRARFPLVPGTDGAGIVVDKGSRVRRFDIGDQVYGEELGGFYAQYVALPAEHVARVPRSLDLLQAGAAGVTGLTALQGIEALRLRPKETVLIFGASGAVGTLAVQFAKGRKARVVATASGREAAAMVKRLGADDVIDARNDRGIKQLRKLAPDGIDAALVLAGGDELERCLDLIRDGGRVAYPNGVEPAPRRRPRIRLIAYDGEPGPRQFARLERAISDAKLRVPIAEVFPLAQAAKAHERLEEGHVLGRMVLRTSGG